MFLNSFGNGTKLKVLHFNLKIDVVYAIKGKSSLNIDMTGVFKSHKSNNITENVNKQIQRIVVLCPGNNFDLELLGECQGHRLTSWYHLVTIIMWYHQHSTLHKIIPRLMI